MYVYTVIINIYFRFFTYIKHAITILLNREKEGSLLIEGLYYMYKAR